MMPNRQEIEKLIEITRNPEGFDDISNLDYAENLRAEKILEFLKFGDESLGYEEYARRNQNNK